jgi:hypothetical protein
MKPSSWGEKDVSTSSARKKGRLKTWGEGREGGMEGGGRKVKKEGG